VFTKEAEQAVVRDDRERERERRERERDRHRREKEDPAERPSNPSNSFFQFFTFIRSIVLYLVADGEREEAAVKERYLGIVKVNKIFC
jgi:hypothetical protein